jgi:hypothetical protein
MEPRVSAPLRTTLRAVAELMTAAREPWWIIAGAAAALHGALGAVKDVDVLLGEEDAMRLLPVLGLTPAPGPASDRFRSVLFARWAMPPVPVEFMAGFGMNTVHGWHDVAFTTRERLEIDGRALFVPTTDELIDHLRMLGRPKDLARIRLLERGPTS